jgi:hypothetical protein
MSPTTSAVIINGVTPAPATSSGPPPFVDVWLNKLAVVTTLAGDGSTAIFNGLRGVTALPNGNFIIADTDNHRIRVVTPTGTVSTLAGNGSTIFTNGTGTAATFNTPFGSAVLPNGNIVVADTNNHRIRLITMPDGVVSTLAGDGTAAFLNGTGAGARFAFPKGITALSNGNIVVADPDNHRIRLITMPGIVVTTLAGDGTSGYIDGIGTGASFRSPRGIAMLPNGNIVIVDTENNRIRLITMPGGVVSTLAGDGNAAFLNGTGTVARFFVPQGITTLPNGSVAVADTANNRVRLITPT